MSDEQRGSKLNVRLGARRRQAAGVRRHKKKDRRVTDRSPRGLESLLTIILNCAHAPKDPPQKIQCTEKRIPSWVMGFGIDARTDVLTAVLLYYCCTAVQCAVLMFHLVLVALHCIAWVDRLIG